MKTSRVLLILALATIFGVAAGYSALQYLNRRPAAVQASSGDGTVTVVLASRDLPLGKVLEEADLQLVEWPAGTVPAGVAGTKEEVVGRSLIANVQSNEAILSTKLADTGLRGIIPLISPGMRAMSIAVDQVVGVSGFVTPQTRVDVILIMNPPGSRDAMSKVILQNVEALAAGEEIQTSEDGTPVRVPVVTLLLTPEEAETLALAANEGQIRLALRNTQDQDPVETQGQRASRLLSGAPRAFTRQASGATSPAARVEESEIEIYRAGVRTLIRY